MAATQKRIAEPAQNHANPGLFAVVAGLFFFVSILKFGTPVILNNVLLPPENALAAVFESWRVEWGYWLMLPLIVTGLAAVRWKTLRFKWPLALPLAWLGWQFIAATQSVSPKLTAMTLEHFSACVILFYLGCFALQGVRNPWPLWAGLALALCWVMRIGLEQHFGGLEATRHFLSQMKDGTDLPPGILNDPAYLKRIASSRIFSTFSNPDALAGGIELLLPVTLVFLWQITPKVRTAVRGAFVAILGGCGLACLYWSGSKAGWLITLVVGMAALGHSTLPTKWKRILIYGVLILGVAGFGVRYTASFKKQQISVSTRFTYWQAALEIAAKHPVLGTGPGTFSVLYGQIKHPDDDFARLCHNDYLEQACDSGVPGFIVYAAMIVGYLSWLYRCRVRSRQGFSTYFAVWLGLLGLCLHSMVEYHLYIPALAWPMFFLMGLAMNYKD
jgi:hypothetical protein